MKVSQLLVKDFVRITYTEEPDKTLNVNLPPWYDWNIISYPHIVFIKYSLIFCSRRSFKQSGKVMKNPNKWKFNYWKELKTLWQKEKLLIISNISFFHNVFKFFIGRGVRRRLYVVKGWWCRTFPSPLTVSKYVSNHSSFSHTQTLITDKMVT